MATNSAKDYSRSTTKTIVKLPRVAAPRRPPIRTGSGGLQAILNQEPPPPPTPEEVETAITPRRDRVEKVWGRIEEYIIGLTCPALYFTITNVAESFLHDLGNQLRGDRTARTSRAPSKHARLRNPARKRTFPSSVTGARRSGFAGRPAAQGFKTHDHRSVVGDEQEVGCMLAYSLINPGFQQERLGNDAAHHDVEIGVQQPRQLQARLRAR